MEVPYHDKDPRVQGSYCKGKFCLLCVWRCLVLDLNVDSLFLLLLLLFQQVLHMDQSPDGGCVVSAAADETLRFWDVFGSPPNERKGNNLAMGNFCGSPSIR